MTKADHTEIASAQNLESFTRMDLIYLRLDKIKKTENSEIYT